MLVSEMTMLPLLEPFEQQLKSLEKDIKGKKSIKIGTLGPSGTSSEQAVHYMITHLQSTSEECKYDIKLQNDFMQVFCELDDCKIDFALIPTAYEKVTDFFWHNKFSNVLNFVYPTPSYGMVSRGNLDYNNIKKIRVATCPAVERLYSYFLEDLHLDCEIELVKTRSTTEAVLFILENKADMGITNQTSFEIYKEEGLKFISKKHHAKIVWSLFKNNLCT